MMKILKSPKTGKRWVIIKDEAFMLEAEGSPAFDAKCLLQGRQMQNALNGRHPEMEEYIRACEHFGLPMYYSYSGIINSLGDHASMAPPWKPRPIQDIMSKVHPEIIEI